MKWPWSVLWFAVPLLAQESPHFRTEVNLVRVPLTVTQANGAPVQDLRREEFVVLEDGVPQKVRYLWSEKDLPLAVILVNDSSCESPQFVAQHRQAIRHFVEHVLSGNDQAGIVAAADQTLLVRDWTSSADELRSRILHPYEDPQPPVLGDYCRGLNPGLYSAPIAPCGYKVLWNAVFFSAELKLRPQQARKAILILSDGRDTGSDHNLKEAIAACQRADAVVYSICWARADRASNSMYGEYAHWGDRGKPDLASIAWDTGGLAFPGGKKPLGEIFGRIEEDLRNQYVVGYTPSATNSRRSYHKLKVKVTRPGLIVRAREGYYSE